MTLRIALFILGLVIFFFAGWAAIGTWATVFTDGPGTVVDTKRGGSRTAAEAPAIGAALVATLGSLLGAFTVGVAGADAVRRRRWRAAPEDGQRDDEATRESDCG